MVRGQLRLFPACVQEACRSPGPAPGCNCDRHRPCAAPDVLLPLRGAVWEAYPLPLALFEGFLHGSSRGDLLIPNSPPTYGAPSPQSEMWPQVCVVWQSQASREWSVFPPPQLSFLPVPEERRVCFSCIITAGHALGKQHRWPAETWVRWAAGVWGQCRCDGGEPAHAFIAEVWNPSFGQF